MRDEWQLVVSAKLFVLGQVPESALAARLKDAVSSRHPSDSFCKPDACSHNATGQPRSKLSIAIDATGDETA